MPTSRRAAASILNNAIMTGKNTRNSSIELLRLVLMLMIVLHHCIAHGMGLAGISAQNAQTPVMIDGGMMATAFVLNGFLISAVNCFVLISGYFGIKVSARKLLSLILAIFLYALFFNAVPLACEGDWSRALRRLAMFLSYSPYWFAIDYLFLMVLAPMANSMYKLCSRRECRLVLLGLLVISCYFGFWRMHVANINGFTIIQFLTMYCVGREIRLSDWRLGRAGAWACYLVPSAVCGVAGYVLWQHGQAENAWRTTYYNDPLLMLGAVGLFMIFKDITLHSRWINAAAASAFGIYLLQTSLWVSHEQYAWISAHTQAYGPWMFAVSAALSLAICLAAIAIDRLRLLAVNTLLDRLPIGRGSRGIE